jgi:hypothetical protein
VATREARRPIRRLLIAAVLVAVCLAATPAAAAILNEVQTGTTTMPAGSATTSVALARAVDPTHAFVVCTSRTTSQAPTRRVTGELSGSETTVTLTQGAADGSTVVRYVNVGSSANRTAASEVKARSAAGATLWS